MVPCPSSKGATVKFDSLNNLDCSKLHSDANFSHFISVCKMKGSKYGSMRKLDYHKCHIMQQAAITGLQNTNRQYKSA